MLEKFLNLKKIFFGCYKIKRLAITWVNQLKSGLYRALFQIG